MRAGEWLRGHVFTGFPWNLPAYGWGASLAMLQIGSLIGAYGLIFPDHSVGRIAGGAVCEPPRWRLPAAMAAAVRCAVGCWRAPPGDAAHHDGAGVHLRLVQPNIPQAEKYRRDLMLRNWQRLIDSAASQPTVTARPPIIVWPEAAPPVLLRALAGGAGPDRALTARAQIAC